MAKEGNVTQFYFYRKNNFNENLVSGLELIDRRYCSNGKHIYKN